MRCPQGPAGGRVPGGRAVSSRLSRSLTPLASRRSWTRSRTPQSMSLRSRKTWTSCTTRWTWRTPATAAPTWRMTTASSAPPSRSSGGSSCASIPDAGTATCLQSQRPVGASRKAAHQVVLGARREGDVWGSRPSGVWALGRGWTGGTDPEGALGLRASRGGVWRRESPVWSQPGSAPQEAVSGKEGRVGRGPGRDQWCPGAIHPVGSRGGGTGGPPGAGVWDSADGRGPGAGGGLQPGLEPGEPKSEAGRSVAWLIIRR